MRSRREVTASPTSPTDGYETENFADDVALVLDALEPTRAAIVGHSSACLVGRRFALDHPERVAGLLLEASPLAPGADNRLAEFVTSTAAKLEDPLDPDFVRAFVGDTSGPVSQSFIGCHDRGVVQGTGTGLACRVRRLLRHDDTAELQAVEASTLLVWGDEDMLVGRDTQDALCSAIPNAELLVYPGVGHTPHWKAPRRFAADLVAFVERVFRSSR